MDINNTFKYHSPTAEQVLKYQEIRETAKAFAHLIVATTPASREQSIALTKLQETVMFANAAIAINGAAANG